MLDFKKEIANAIEEATKLNSDEIYGFIEIPKDSENGDYAFPCFKLAKQLRKSPAEIARNITERIQLDDDIIERMEVAVGYINFFFFPK